jgi:hypothetical protein
VLFRRQVDRLDELRQRLSTEHKTVTRAAVIRAAVEVVLDVMRQRSQPELVSAFQRHLRQSTGTSRKRELGA